MRHKLFHIIISIILIGFISSFLFSTLLPKSRAANNEEQTIVDYGDEDDPEEWIIAYHEGLNEFLNNKMDAIMEADTQTKLENQEKIPKKRPDGSRNFKECLNTENYTSTWCVSMVMTDEYYRLRGKLLVARQKLVTDLSGVQEKAAKELQKRRKKNPSISEKDLAPKYQDYITAIQKMDAMIDRELGIARKTLEMAVAAYDEFHVAWILHKKYMNLTDQLEDYRNALAKIRDEVELFPVTFFNVQTSQCT